RHLAVAIHLVRDPEANAFPLAGLREEVLPGDRAVVRRIEADAGKTLAQPLVGSQQAARVRDAGEQCEIRLRDTEREVRTVGIAPRRDFLAADVDDARDAAAL